MLVTAVPALPYLKSELPERVVSAFVALNAVVSGKLGHDFCLCEGEQLGPYARRADPQFVGEFLGEHDATTTCSDSNSDL